MEIEKQINEYVEKIKHIIRLLNNDNATGINIKKHNISIDNPILKLLLERDDTFILVDNFLRKVNIKDRKTQIENYIEILKERIERIEKNTIPSLIKEIEYNKYQIDYNKNKLIELNEKY